MNEVIDWLMFRSYCYQRAYGANAAQLVAVGFDPRFEALYAEQIARAA